VDYPYRDYPELTERHLREAKLYSSRKHLLADLKFLRGGVIAEVGVAYGDFSEFILKTLEPKIFVAFDLFQMHNMPVAWGVPTSVTLKGMTHVDFYKNRFASRGDQVVIEVGNSNDTVPCYQDKLFDMIYIDAAHDYEGVKRDAQAAAVKIKEDGVLIFNDYIMYDHLLQAPYGVVRAVNELITAEDWSVIGFALQPHMFCDIAIRRKSLSE
jgi:Methyltransferase domain